MRDATARTVMMVLLLAGLALALPTQGAAARGGSAGVTIIVNGDRGAVQRVVKAEGVHRFAGHRVHRFGARAFYTVPRHSRHAFHGSKRHAAGKVAAGAFQRNAAHHAGFHHDNGRHFSKPRFHAPRGKGFSGPRLISVGRSGTQRLDGHGVVVFKGSGFHSFAGAARQAPEGAGGKLILLAPSPHFKHIVVVPSHRPAVD